MRDIVQEWTVQGRLGDSSAGRRQVRAEATEWTVQPTRE